MDGYDPERKIGLVMDEWGTWHPPVEGRNPGSAVAAEHLRDALVAASTLDVFNSRPTRLIMGNIAQTINVLQALCWCRSDRWSTRPPTTSIDLYQPHKGATAVRCIAQAESVSDGGAAKDHCRRMYLDKSAFALKAVQGSASVKDGALCVTACNTHPSQPVELEIDLVGARLDSAEVVRLAADDIHAHNTFERPEQVKLSAPEIVSAKGNTLRVAMPAASIVRVMGKLA